MTGETQSYFELWTTLLTLITHFNIHCYDSPSWASFMVLKPHSKIYHLSLKTSRKLTNIVWLYFPWGFLSKICTRTTSLQGGHSYSLCCHCRAALIWVLIENRYHAIFISLYKQVFLQCLGVIVLLFFFKCSPIQTCSGHIKSLFENW